MHRLLGAGDKRPAGMGAALGADYSVHRLGGAVLSAPRPLRPALGTTARWMMVAAWGAHRLFGGGEDELPPALLAAAPLVGALADGSHHPGVPPQRRSRRESAFEVGALALYCFCRQEAARIGGKALAVNKPFLALPVGAAPHVAVRLPPGQQVARAAVH